ncbi:hypothetical protein KBC31_03540 [Candidatus Saccharibacteria bacterium]|jgi:4-hydroxy-tetrahydrodipicolinate reductase|nr:hypothetical protein [Candidatus Saccharibacteria bacterium]
MKIALLGSGRTGAYLHEVIAPGDKITDFNSTNKASVSKLAEFDVVICFLPGDILNNYFDMLLKSKTPTIIGSTGYQFPDKIDEKIFQQNITWIWANNFSLGMQVAKNAIEALTIARKILPNAKTSIHEVHHTNKKDAPSGTAISWMQWYGDKNIEISSERVGDVVGDHTLTIDADTETITLAHSSKHRKIFAEGAYWSALRITSLKPGLHEFSEVVKTYEGENK